MLFYDFKIVGLGPERGQGIKNSLNHLSPATSCDKSLILSCVSVSTSIKLYLTNELWLTYSLRNT